MSGFTRLETIIGLTPERFINNEKWRKEYGTDDLVSTFEYTEKPLMFEYYPQYYHKTDKVRSRCNARRRLVCF